MSDKGVAVANTANFQTIAMVAVMKEVGISRGIHGAMTTDLMRAHLILAEEVGEFAQAVADFTRVHIGHEGQDRHGATGQNLGRVRDELIQTMCVAWQILENIMKGDVQWPEGKR